MVAEEGLRQWQRLAEHATAVAIRYPSDATLLVYLARAQAQRGLTDQARAAYAAVLERFPGHEEAEAYLSDSRRQP
jgi:TolA-binding protein